MKISRNWLNDYVVSNKADAELVDAFTQLGLECTSQKINSIDILKIDIEGSEYELLKGAKNTLKRNKIKIILVEIIDKKNSYKKKEEKIINLLKNFTLIKKANIWSISLFSNIRGGDYLFINNKYLK